MANSAMLKLNCAAASESESATFTAGMTGKKRCTASGAMNATRPSAKAKARPGTCRRDFSTVVKRLRWGQRRGLRLACAGGQRYARLDRAHTYYTHLTDQGDIYFATASAAFSTRGL